MIKTEIGAFKISNDNFQKFSGVHFDNRLTFEYHMLRVMQTWIDIFI